MLARAPDEITLGEVMRRMGGPLLAVADSAKNQKAVFSKIWNEVENAMSRVLDKVNFEDIRNRAKGREETILYQI